MRQEHFVVRPVRGDMVWIDDLVDLLQVMQAEAREYEARTRDRQLVFHIPNTLPDVQAWDAELEATTAVVDAVRAYIRSLDDPLNTETVGRWMAVRDKVAYLDGVQHSVRDWGEGSRS